MSLSPAMARPSGCEPVRMSWRFGLSPRPLTIWPFSSSPVCLLILLFACRSSTLRAISSPFAFFHGPLPIRSRALTLSVLRYARHSRCPAPAAFASAWQCRSAPSSPPRSAPLPGPALVMKKVMSFCCACASAAASKAMAAMRVFMTAQTRPALRYFNACRPRPAPWAWPTRPIRFILPFPPGGGTDILGRLIAERLSANLGQPVVTENRGGAGGNVGAEAAARSASDGYTIVLAAPSLAISPTLYSKLNYDPVKDFAPISLVATVPNVMITHPSVQAQMLQECIALVRARPGAMNCGSWGSGTSHHLAGV